MTANIENINKTIKIFERKIANWEKEPIADHLVFILYVLSKLPPLETSKNNSHYAVDELNGSYRIRISDHNAKSKNFIGKIGKCKVGITFKSKDEESSFIEHEKVFYKEHVYYTEYLASEVPKKSN
ncbi:MAG: hypothetical protein MJ069_04110 [Salinivirgaceae bacterium]|nr:hypothetical protein [Salinivirgaceae bacterium]